MNLKKNKNAEVLKIASHMLSYCDSSITATFAMWDSQPVGKQGPLGKFLDAHPKTSTS